MPKTGKSCGIDIGVSDFYNKVDSDGNVEISNKLNLDKTNKRAVKLQQSMARKRFVNSKKVEVIDANGKTTKNIKYRSYQDIKDDKGKVIETKEIWTDYYIPSNNYNKDKKKYKETCQTATNRKMDKAHKEIINIIRNNDKICMETLNIQDLQKRNKLQGKKKKWINRQLQQLSWGKFINIMDQKCKMYGRDFVLTPLYYPSSQFCSNPNCNYQYTGLQLSEREWICPICNTFYYRDENACLNLLDYMIDDKQEYKIIHQKYINNTIRGGSPVSTCLTANPQAGKNLFITNRTAT